MTKIEGLTIFTEEEFQTIVDELFNKSESGFNTLLKVIDRAFSRNVENWANSTSFLKGGLHHEDVMQEIRIKVCKNVVTNFFKHERANGEINYDPLGFQKWLCTVVKHEKISYFNQMLRVRHCTIDLNDTTVESMVENLASTTEDYYGEFSSRERLEEAFKVVIESEARPYTVLTWIAARLFFIEVNEKGGEISSMVDSAFGNKTLYQMRDMLFQATERIKWMKLTEKGKEKINKALDTLYNGISPYGEMRYYEFYMSKGAKASISDWINKMDNIIKKQVAAK